MTQMSPTVVAPPAGKEEAATSSEEETQPGQQQQRQQSGVDHQNSSHSASESDLDTSDESTDAFPQGGSTVGRRLRALRGWLKGGAGAKHSSSPDLEAKPIEEDGWEDPGNAPAAGLCTMEMQSLGLAAMLFTTITICQVFGALASHSQALLIDCISMGVDAGSMVGNMGAEALKGTPYHRPVEVLVGGVSVAALLYFTAFALLESATTLRDTGAAAGAGDSVDGGIVMAFALAGLLFDVVSLYVFRRSHKKNKSGREMNIWTAIMHVGADFLRSTTTFVLSILIMGFTYDSTLLDAWASLVVGLTILVGGVIGLFGWIRNVVKLCHAESTQLQAES